jgi:hypothetical protein
MILRGAATNAPRYRLPVVERGCHCGLEAGDVDRRVRGDRKDASDHAPVWIELMLPSRARGPPPP